MKRLCEFCKVKPLNKWAKKFCSHVCSGAGAEYLEGWVKSAF